MALVLLSLGLVGLGIMFTHARVQAAAAGPSLTALAGVVSDLGLTDLAFFTEARYTRHLSQADRYAPFQDHPCALEHFPTGSFAPPPAALREAP